MLAVVCHEPCPKRYIFNCSLEAFDDIVFVQTPVEPMDCNVALILKMI